MLNDDQRRIATIGALLATVMILVPPYFDIGGLFGGVRFAFILHPPTRNVSLDIHPAIASVSLLLQLSAVVSFTVSAILAYYHPANRVRMARMRRGAVATFLFALGYMAFSLFELGRGWLDAPFLVCLIPVQYPGGYFLFCLRLATLAWATLLWVLIPGRRTKPTPLNRIAAPIAAAILILLLIVTVRTALR